MGALAFGGSIAALVILIGTRDLESYELAVFSLDRGTAVDAVRILGHPVYTLDIGLGARLPLHGSLGASPAALVSPFLPVPLTYALLLACAIAAATLVVRHALQPACGRVIAWLAAVLLFWSVPMVNYTIYDDWPETAVTYCALVASVFAPHAMLALSALPARGTRRIAWLSVLAATWGLLALAHPGYWPVLALALTLTALLALGRFDCPLRTRLLAVAALAVVSCGAVALPSLDILRDLGAATAGGATRRLVEGARGSLIGANVFPFGELGARFPFTFLALALASTVVAIVASPGRHLRLVIIGAALMSAALGIAAATLPPSTSLFAPSVTWSLRDPAVIFAIASGAYAAAAALRRLTGRRAAVAAAALAITALQGPAYALALVVTDRPQSPQPWTQDLTAPDVRVAERGLGADRVPPGARLALWPDVGERMRGARGGTADLADAGYRLVTIRTKQRTMRGIVGANEIVFNQNTYLAADVLCDEGAVRFLQIQYLLRPSGAAPCTPWEPVAGVQVDEWLDLDVARAHDTRIRALPAARLGEAATRTPALAAESALLPALTPLPRTSLAIASTSLALRLDDPAAARGQALVLPVAYDDAWRSSSGEIRSIGGLLGLVAVDASHTTLTYVPDGVAALRVLSMIFGQLFAVLGFIGFAWVERVTADEGGRDTWSAIRARVAASPFAPLQEPRDWLYAAYSAAVILSGGPFAALLLPVAALTIARLTQPRMRHRLLGAALLAAAVVRAIAGGSLAAEALRDPLFWAIAALVLLAIAAATARRPRIWSAAAAAAGASALVAAVLPRFPEALVSLTTETPAAMGAALGVLAERFGGLPAALLIALWVQAITIGGRDGPAGPIGAASRGALAAALLLALGGAIPQDDATAATWLVVLGVLLGLAEAGARPPAPRIDWAPLWQRVNPSGWNPIAVLLVLEALFALLLLRTPGTGDVTSFFLGWIDAFLTDGLAEGYRRIDSNYPPLVAVVLLAAGALGRAASLGIFLSFKILLAAALIVSTLCFWRWTRDIVLTSLLALSLLVNGVALGYLDTLFAPPLILSLWALQRRRIALFSVLFAVASLIKWQPLVVLPFLLLHAVSTPSASTSRTATLKRWTAVALPAIAVMLATLTVFGMQSIQAALRQGSNRNYLSGTAQNLNWIVTYVLRVTDPARYGGLDDGLASLIQVNQVDPQWPWPTFATWMFLACYAIPLWRLVASRTSFAATLECSLAAYLAYFMLSIGVHENHLFIGTVLAAAAAAVSPEKRTRAAVIIAMSTLNLVTVYGITGAPLGFAPVVGIDVSVIFAAVNVLLFVIFWIDVVAPRRPLNPSG